jgi:hypothetical protein
MSRILTLLIAGTLLLCSAASAQDYLQLDDQYIELMRSDIRTQRVALITDMMQFSEDEASVFWPIFREYEVELAKIYDVRIEGIKWFAANFDELTDEKAKDLARKTIKFEKDKTKLTEKYYKKLSKELSPTLAAKFFQLERWLNLMVELQVTSMLPFIQ